MRIIEKIKEIEAEMARTQKNKATEFIFDHANFYSVDPHHRYNYIGASGHINLWNRRVKADDEFSTAQIWLMNCPLESFDSVEAGGIDDASQRTWCFNLVCAGFVQTSHEVAIGAAMAATSS
ncbi:hypothetical protein Syun_019808 [Stephania yunnanensis]|uniref:Neprosin PEP catalytic domain-containing protein n=1 Tax=Stephania yunnanensis TaxID=152371 RepID=A0AAP0IX65_9MAGN